MRESLPPGLVELPLTLAHLRLGGGRPLVLADVGPVPDYETLIEMPEDVLKMYARRYQEEGN
jgi:hypothetical protein